MNTAVLIVAAGRGTRLGAEIPKQYIPLDGPCALHRSVLRFLQVDRVTSVRAVIHPDDHALYQAAMAGVDDPRFHPPVDGGATRAASVRNGLGALAADPPDAVLIHDAARPFVTANVIDATIDAMVNHVAACVALPVVDALWKAADGMAETPVSRDGLWRAQTPQAFHFKHIFEAHQAHDGSGDDDVAVARKAGLAVRLITGDEANFKITSAADLARALRQIEATDV